MSVLVTRFASHVTRNIVARRIKDEPTGFHTLALSRWHDASALSVRRRRRRDRRFTPLNECLCCDVNDVITCHCLSRLPSLRGDGGGSGDNDSGGVTCRCN